VSGLPGSMTVYVMKPALVSSGVPTWHLSGRARAGHVGITRCGRSLWDAVAIRRLFAGTFAVRCGTCQKADAAQKRGRS